VERWKGGKVERWKGGAVERWSRSSRLLKNPPTMSTPQWRDAL
jgi:hypothetical protein